MVGPEAGRGVVAQQDLNRGIEHGGHKLLWPGWQPGPCRCVHRPLLPFPTEAERKAEDLEVWEAQATIAPRGANNWPCDLAFPPDHRLRHAPQERPAVLVNMPDSPRRERARYGDVHQDGREGRLGDCQLARHV